MANGIGRKSLSWPLLFSLLGFIGNGSLAVAEEQVLNPVAIENYQKTITDYLKKKSVADGWEWFTHRSHGFGVGATPMILVKLLPELDSTIWGLPSEKFSRFGHFVLPGDEDRPLPSSLGMSSYPTKENAHPLIVTTETCGTCHTGRVRLGGKERFLYGGVNVQFDIRKWRTAWETTVKNYLSTPEELKKTADRLRKIVDLKSDQSNHFFHPNPEEDKRQRDYLTQPGGAEKMLEDFVSWTAGFTKGKQRQRRTSYALKDKQIPPDLDEGHPGQVDALGDLLAQRLPSDDGMPKRPSLTDIPSAWLQSEYISGQWDGTLLIQFIRNLAAQVAVVPGSTVDRWVAFLSLKFVTDLPAPPFPFEIREKHLLAKGKALYKANCLDCHKPRNDRTYPQVQTDLSRANVMTTRGGFLIGKIFFEACTAKLPDGPSPPGCGDLRKALRKDNAAGPSYPAKPLTGIWARAPYLHNGSVPTLEHLLGASPRPNTFVVGSLSYDSEKVGYVWDARKIDDYRKIDPQVSLFETRQDGLSNKGHDQKALELDGKTYRLDWSENKEDAEALLQYLKTL